MSLILFPLSTALGFYALVVYRHPDVHDWFVLAPDHNLVGSWLYAYETVMGTSHGVDLSKLKAYPPIEPGKPVSLFLITPGVGLRYQP